MNDIDLTEILKNCPKGFELYSSIYGTVTFEGIDYHDSNYPICVKTSTLTATFSKEGLYFCSCSDSECCLFPSREQRDWRKFTAPWYKKEKDSLRTNDRAWLYLVSDVLTWKNGIGQYLDNPRVQELAKRLCSEYAQKLYNPSVIEDKKPKNKVRFYVARDRGDNILYIYLSKPRRDISKFYPSANGSIIAIQGYFYKFGLNEKDFDNLKFEDEPIEVFLNLEN